MRKLKEHFKKHRLFINTHYRVFIITNEDKFYEIDKNIFDKNIPLFLSSNKKSIIEAIKANEAMIVNNLSGKEIKHLINGYCHYIARNAEKTYCCGNNSWAQLGNKKKEMMIIN